ncbi:hypothetical protein [Jeotgalibacillus sp. R-1-5s-1]|uniref:hypothetical protein n=1 Tax=Jeotgalibacillus sp. R-1-5s-1 TaxID=2555897 RepID=UPI00106BA95B|nr:hypothetical protein [Jeotgalibacillus sp. R-1-5s-1]TFD97040.1 hypothetical protein E2491_10110 [Jeotgalibacillus sp. R-1-5s-1]
MDKKKAIKLAAASTVAASAVFAAAPAQQADASNHLQTAVKNAVTQMDAAYRSYANPPQLTGELANIADVYAAYNSSVKNYRTVKAQVEASNASNKTQLLAELEAGYDMYIAKRVIPYIDAYNYATKRLAPKVTQMNEAVAQGNFDLAEELYHQVSYELSAATSIFYKFYGFHARDLMLEQFKAIADDSVVEIKVEVTVKMALDAAEAALAEGDIETAVEQFNKAAEFVDQLDNSSFGDALLTQFEAVSEEIDAALLPAVTNVVANSTTDFTVTFEEALAEDADLTLLDVAVELADGTVVYPTPTDLTVSADRTMVTVEHADDDLDGLAGTLWVGDFELAFDYVVPFVESVKSVNAKQVVVEFDKPVQSGVAAGGAQTLTYYTVDGVNPTRVTLSADKTQATLTFAAGLVSNLNKYVEVIVEDVKDVNGKTIEDYKAPLLIQDKVSPTASASYSAPNVKVDFSEPLEIDGVELGSTLTSKAIVSVDGVPTTSYSLVNDNTAGDALTGASGITLSGLSAGEHTISIVGAMDLSGNFLPEFTTKVNVSSDTVAPTVTSLTVEGNNIRVKFSEPVVDTTLNGQASTRVWLQNGAGTVDVYGTSSEAVDSAGTEYLIDASAFVTSGSFLNVPVIVKAGSEDASGNAITSDSTAKNLVITKDTKAPSVVSTTTKDDKIIVKFDESIQAGSTPITTLDVRYTNSDGVVVVDSTATQSGLAYSYDANNDGDTTDAGEDRYLVITVDDTDFVSGGKLKNGSYVVNLATDFVSDNAATVNQIGATTLQFNVANGAQVTDNLTSTPIQVSAGVLQYSFDAVLTTSALNRENFTINGAALPAGTKLYFFGNKQVVRAELPANTISVNGNRTLAVKNIVDEDGNTLDAASKQGTVVSLTENVKPTAQSATLQSGTQLNVEMSESLSSPVTATGIEVYVNGVKIDTTTNALSFAAQNGAKGTDSLLTITAANANTFALGQTIVVRFVDGNTVQDLNSNTVAPQQITVSTN